MTDEQLKIALQPEIKLPGFDNISLDIFSKVPSTGNVKEEIKEETTVEEPEIEIKENEVIKESEEVETTAIKVKKEEKKEEEIKEPEEPEEDSIIAVLKSKLNAEDLEDEFPEDLDGVEQFVKKVVEKEKASSFVEGQEELLEKTPVLKALKEHLDAGYGITSFLQKQQTTDWDSIVFKDKDDKENLELAERVFIHAKVLKGDTEEEAREAWETAKDKGTAIDRAETAKKYLKGLEDTQVANQQKLEKEANDKIKKEEAESLAEAEKVLKSGNILGISFTPEKIKELKKFSFEQDNKGLTARDKRIAAMTIEEGLFLDAILQNNFKDFGVKAKPVTTNTATVFQKLKQATDAKKKISLGGGEGSSANSKIDARSLFNN